MYWHLLRSCPIAVPRGKKTNGGGKLVAEKRCVCESHACAHHARLVELEPGCGGSRNWAAKQYTPITKVAVNRTRVVE
tara:strand:- start:927 stop:1160 length:234 start_codon:yes stop_codon:yes gene_type:complete